MPLHAPSTPSPTFLSDNYRLGVLQLQALNDRLLSILVVQGDNVVCIPFEILFHRGTEGTQQVSRSLTCCMSSQGSETGRLKYLICQQDDLASDPYALTSLVFGSRLQTADGETHTTV